MSPAEARDRVWGHLDEIDWSKYQEIPDELVEKAQAVFYGHYGSPVDQAERLVMVVTGDRDPDILLAFEVTQLIARALDGRKLSRYPDPADLDAFATAVAFVLGVRAKQTELEGDHDGA